MARKSDPHSATAQFFINLVDNGSLNFRNKSQGGYGYCVFGAVIEGMEVIDAMAEVRTRFRLGHDDVPVEPILLKKAEIVQSEE